MNHDIEYTKLILNAKYEELMNIRKKKNGNYYERHHIVPKCFGGTNDPFNIVLLTAREHFIAHQLLVEIHRDDKKKYHQMVSALRYMAYNKHKDGYQITPEEYEKIKIENSKMLSELHKGKTHSKGKKHTEECKKAQSERMKGNFIGEKHPRYGKTNSKESNIKRSNALKGVYKSHNTKLNMRIAKAKYRLKNNLYPNRYGYTRESDLLLISQEIILND